MYPFCTMLVTSQQIHLSNGQPEVLKIMISKFGISFFGVPFQIPCYILGVQY